MDVRSSSGCVCQCVCACAHVSLALVCVRMCVSGCVCQGVCVHASVSLAWCVCVCVCEEQLLGRVCARVCPWPRRPRPKGGAKAGSHPPPPPPGRNSGRTEGLRAPRCGGRTFGKASAGEGHGLLSCPSDLPPCWGPQDPRPGPTQPSGRGQMGQRTAGSPGWEPGLRPALGEVHGLLQANGKGRPGAAAAALALGAQGV